MFITTVSLDMTVSKETHSRATTHMYNFTHRYKIHLLFYPSLTLLDHVTTAVTDLVSRFYANMEGQTYHKP